MVWRRRLLEVTSLGLLVAACVGTDVGNPDGNRGSGGTVGTGGNTGAEPGAGGDLGTGGDTGVPSEAVPEHVDLGTVCADGVGRAALVITNRTEIPQSVSIEVQPPLEALPDEATVDPGGSHAFALLWSDPEAAFGAHEGSLDVRVDDEAHQVRWTLELAAEDRPRGHLLCGGEAPCPALLFFGADEPLSLQVQVVNDGCAPLEVQGLESTGEPAPRLLPEDEASLPIILQPGERWDATLTLEPADSPGARGRVLLRTDDPTVPSTPWSHVLP